MTFNKDVIEAIGNTPLIKLKRASEADRLHHSRQGRIHESRPVGQGPRRQVDDPGGREARRPQARRARGGSDRGQYRHRSCGRRQRARLPHLDPDPGNAEPGKEGHAAAVRRRAGRSAGAALFQSEQLSACRAAAGRPASQDRAERRVVRRSVEQSRQRQGALRVHRSGDLGADRRQDRRLHLLGRHRRHAGRHQPLSEGKAPGHRQRLRRSAWLCDVRAVQARHRQIDAGRLDHRRHRARPRHAGHRDREGRRRLPDFRTRKP